MEGKFPPLAGPIGVDLDERLVYAADTKDGIHALDLETRRVRPIGTGIRAATVGPSGALFTVSLDNHVTENARRIPVSFRDKLPGVPRVLFGTGNDQLIALLGGDSTRVALLGSDLPAASLVIPDGAAAATYWGDLVAIAADTAVVLYEPGSSHLLRSIPVSGHARAVVFSASGHRLYVARRDDDQLLVLDRYSDKTLDQIHLPGPSGALRPDPYGRWLLVKPLSSDSVWVVDLGANRLVGGWAADWGPDLPAVTSDGLLLVKQGSDVFAWDLANPEGAELARIRGGARDLWMVIPWNPEGGTTVVSADSVAQATTDTTTRSNEVYLQVSSSQNASWAGELAGQLSDAGLPAKVLKPRRDGDGYRVVLGPYSSREEAEAAGRKLGRPFFIYHPEDPSSR